MTPEHFLVLLGRQLREQRKRRGLSQERLAELAGLSTRYLSQIESGRGNLSILRLLELTRALGVPLHDAVRPDKWHPIVALVGLRGAGKSTVGQELARRLDRPFIELDGLIEDDVGLSLAEIFAIHGESYYRRFEHEALSRIVSNGEPAVLATGGSIVTDRTTLDLLKKGTITIWLRARPELHLQRVATQGDRRPMAGRADPLSELRSLLMEREKLYAEADICIDTSTLSANEVASEVLAKIEGWES
jgi:XRE family aerobic/anaerobic benzoate catabolism transcriptional regulator